MAVQADHHTDLTEILAAAAADLLSRVDADRSDLNRAQALELAADAVPRAALSGNFKP